MWSVIKVSNPVWFVDATGGVHSKVNGQKAPFLYSAVCHDEKKKQIIPVFEFISTEHTGESIAKYMTFAISRIVQNTKSNEPFSVAPVIVCDFSFALINGILKSVNHITLTDYIKYCFDILFQGNNSLYMRTHIYLCSTHFLKSMIKKVREWGSNSLGKMMLR